MLSSRMTGLLSIPAALVGGALGFALGFYGLALTGKCPPQTTCDLPLIAGLGLGLLLAIVGGFVGVWALTRFIAKRSLW